eukprot:3235675-Rhodomonas_salina.1
MGTAVRRDTHTSDVTFGRRQLSNVIRIHECVPGCPGGNSSPGSRGPAPPQVPGGYPGTRVPGYPPGEENLPG